MATEQDQNKQQPLPASLEQAAEKAAKEKFTIPEFISAYKPGFFDGAKHILNSLPATTVYVAVEIKGRDTLPSEPGKYFVIKDKTVEVATYNSTHHEWYWENSIHSREKWVIYPSHYLKQISQPDIIGEKDKVIAERDKHIQDLINAVDLRELIDEKNETIKQKEQEIERLKGLLNENKINPETGKQYFSDIDPEIFNHGK